MTTTPEAGAAPTPEQQAAITTIDRPLGIVAGAGAGKTRVLVERCAYLLQQGVLLSRLLVITFTDRAAQELRTRLFAMLPPDTHQSLHGAAITTFHGLCLRILQAHAPLVGLAPNFRVLDAAEAAHLQDQTLHEALRTLLDASDAALQTLLSCHALRDIRQGVRGLLEDRWNLAQWRARRGAIEAQAGIPAATEREEAVLQAALAVFDACALCYARTKRARQVADFHDLEILAVQLFDEHPEVLSDYQRQFRHMLVDEFQDTNPIQLALIDRLFTPPDNMLCIVGDPKQSVYRFRGAEIGCFGTMLERIMAHDGMTIDLRTNFRSEPRVLDFVRAACPAIPEEQQMLAHRVPGTGPAVHWLALGSDQHSRDGAALAVAHHILALVRSGDYTCGDIACLFPTRRGMAPYAAALRRTGIPVHIATDRGLLQRREILDLLFALNVCAALDQQRPNDPALLALLRSPLFGLTDDACYQLVHGPDRAPGPVPSHWPILHSCTWRVPWLRDRLESWQAFARVATIPELLGRMLDDTAYLAVLLALDPGGQRVHNVEEFLLFAGQSTTRTALTLPEFLATVAGVQARASLGEQPVTATGANAVQLLTIHATKGNEFPVVILADLTAGRNTSTPHWHFLHNAGLGVRDTVADLEAGQKNLRSARWQYIGEMNAQADAKERDRLLYVALTRARDRLVLPFAVPASGVAPPAKKANGWTNRLAEACATCQIPPQKIDAVVSPAECRAGTATAHTSTRVVQPARTTRRHLHLTVSQLEAFDRCPQEYFLKHALGVPADMLHWPTDTTTIPPPVRGDIVHAVIRRHQATQEPLAQLAREELRKRGWPADVAEDPVLVGLFAAYADTANANATEALVEFPFRMRVGPTSGGKADNSTTALLSGTIDRLARTSRGWEIVDYKTDQIARPADVARHAAAYALQMTTYAIAAHDAGFQPLTHTTLLFLDARTPLTVPVDTTRLQTGRDRLAQIINAIGREDFAIPANVTPPCASCIFQRNQTCALARSPGDTASKN